MRECAKNLDFEQAAHCRDQVIVLKENFKGVL